MKKLLVLIAAIFVLTVSANTAVATDYSNVSDNAKIQNALNLLEVANGQKTLNVVKSHNTKIMFFDLSSISAEYADAHGMATTDDNGQAYILINNKHKNAPAEAIACLIAHEATHQLAQTTINEEVQAWTNEAQQWANFQAMNPSMNYQGELVNRLNRLAGLYANKSNETIALAVRSNSNYANLK